MRSRCLRIISLRQKPSPLHAYSLLFVGVCFAQLSSVHNRSCTVAGCAMAPCWLLSVALLTAHLSRSWSAGLTVDSVDCQPERAFCGSTCQDDPYMMRMPCRCDKLCALYGDCCVDFADECQMQNDTEFQRRVSRYKPFLGCASVDDQTDLNRFRVVARCPADWAGLSVRQQCENDSLAASDRLLKVLVNGPDGVVFGNVFCALCQGLSDAEIVPWRAKLWECERDSAGVTLVNTCAALQVYPPTSMHIYPHACYKKLVDSCPPATNASEVERCEQNQTSLLFRQRGDGGSMLAFKNADCLDCHLRNSDEIFICKAGIIGDRLDPLYSVGLLFDFRMKGVTVDSRRVGSCGESHIYDPFLSVCRDISCPVGWEMLSGKCHRSSTVAGQQAPPASNRTGNCTESVLSWPGLTLLQSTFPSRVSLSPEKGTGAGRRVAVYVQTDFGAADRVREELDALHETVAQSVVPGACDSLTLKLVAPRHFGSTADSEQPPVCEGFTVDDVDLGQINTEGGNVSFAAGGHTYTESQFMHVTVYESVAAAGSGADRRRNSSRRAYARLCDPFVGQGCPLLAMNRSEFQAVGQGDQTVLVHVASQETFSSADIWQLPDGTVRLCNFLSRHGGSDAHGDSLEAWSVLSSLSFAGSIVSIVILCLALSTYSLFRPLRNRPGKIVMNLMVAMILGDSWLVIGKLPVPWVCSLRAAMLHFSWLAVFTWMSMLAADLTVVLKSNTHRRFQQSDRKLLLFGAVAWGGPALFVTGSFSLSVMDEDRSLGLVYGGPRCWIEGPLQSLLVFGIPIACLLLVNCLMLASMVVTVTVNRRRLAAAHLSVGVRTDILLFLKLAVITGLAWSLFLVSNLVDSIVIWFISVTLNSLQGALIGLVFLANDNVRALWRQKLRIL